MSQQKITLEIPRELRPAQRQQLADLVIVHIIDRSQRGIDKNDKKFPKYSEGYIHSAEFKNAGKKPNPVNLELSGEMLTALDLLSNKAGEITIGYKRGTPENAKAEGNILGSYGRSPNPAKARDFLGIKNSKLKELVDFVVNNGD